MDQNQGYEKHANQPTGFGAYSSTFSKWDWHDVPAPREYLNSHDPVQKHYIYVINLCVTTCVLDEICYQSFWTP